MSGQTSIAFKSIVEHLGSDINAEEACELELEVHDDTMAPA